MASATAASTTAEPKMGCFMAIPPSGVSGPRLARRARLAPGRRVCGLRQRCRCGKKLLRLTREEPAGGESLDGADSGADGFGRSENGADRELSIEEDRRLRH